MNPTDHAWEQWGRQDPYFGVITDPRLRRDRLSDTDRAWFFETGRAHVHYVFDVVRQRLDPLWRPQRALDFGCGVGRVLIPLAQAAREVVGIDVSAAMLDEARANIATGGLSNVQLHHQGDLAGLAAGSFDFVHSALVLQHIDIERGIRLFGDLVGLLGPRGVGALQFTYAKTAFAATFGVPPPTPMPASRRGLRAVGAAIASATLGRDPEMQMNAYPLNPLLFQLQAAQIARFHAEFTDHGGELGLFLFFQKP